MGALDHWYAVSTEITCSDLCFPRLTGRDLRTDVTVPGVGRHVLFAFGGSRESITGMTLARTTDRRDVRGRIGGDAYDTYIHDIDAIDTHALYCEAVERSPIVGSVARILASSGSGGIREWN